MAEVERGRTSQGNAPGRDLDSVAVRLADVARKLQGVTHPDQTLQAIVESAVQMVPGAAHASITEVRRRQEVSVRLATSELAVKADLAQYQTGEGPCLDAAYDHLTLLVDDFETETRWPSFAASARDLGLSSLLSVQLYVEKDDLGALNLYGSQPYVFDDEAESVALLFATHAAVAMAAASGERQLRVAIDSRDVIGQAKGILMERHSIDASTAFAVLTRVSQDTNTKLIDVARHLTETGVLNDH